MLQPCTSDPALPRVFCSPLVFDLALQVVKFGMAGDDRPVDPTGWSILHVYGSPNPNETALSSDGTVMRVGWAREDG